MRFNVKFEIYSSDYEIQEYYAVPASGWGFRNKKFGNQSGTGILCMMRKIVLVVLVVLLGGASLWFLGVVILNSEDDSLPEQLEFYKEVSFSMNVPDSDLEEAKDLGANIVGFAIPVFPKEDDTWGLGNSPPEGGENWQEIMSVQVRKAHEYGLHAAIGLVFYPEQLTRDPESWLEHARPLYRELGKFANRHNVYSVSVPGEIESVIGATCCSLDPRADLEPTSNNELSAKGFAHWSSKISHGLKDELRKNFNGYVAATYIAGNWWFEDERFVGPEPWDMEGFDAIISGIQLDDPAFVDDAVGVSQRRARVLREVAQASRVDKVIFEVPPINAILKYTRSRDFQLTDQEREPLYEAFFQETHTLLDGYSLLKFPPPHYDPAAFMIAEEWYAKLPID